MCREKQQHPETTLRIKLKTGGILGQYLPEGSARNRAELEVDPGTTPLDVMKTLGLPLDDPYLVALNGIVVVKQERATQELTDGDELVLMPPLKGG